jgi:myosin-1
MHVPREYDNLVENDKKTEIVAILMEYYEALTGRKLPVQFSDRIQYKIKSGDTRELAFSKNEAATSAPILKKAGRTLKVEVASGLPRDTGTLPSFMSITIPDTP